MVKVCAICDFRDTKENIYRKVGDRFEVTEDRYFEIIEKGGDWVVPVATLLEDVKKDKKMSKKNKKTGKGE